jgi:selenoprotein W-related protein
LAEEMLHDFPGSLGSVTLIPSSGGVYEIKLDDQLIYSRKATGEFPDPEQIKQHVGSA